MKKVCWLMAALWVVCAGIPASVAAGEAEAPREGEIVYLYDMPVEEITQCIGGAVFQAGSDVVAANMGEVICFLPDGTYYWFCSAMDQQSRIRAEYGRWALEKGFLTTAARKLIEWVDGHFVAADDSTASRYALEDFRETLTEVDIQSEGNFHMFRFLRDGSGEEAMGFYYAGQQYYGYTGGGGVKGLRENYGWYFSLFEE